MHTVKFKHKTRSYRYIYLIIVFSVTAGRNCWVAFWSPYISDQWCREPRPPLKRHITIWRI